ncbi:hypothetical protein Tco_0571632 [Tanacetum coccineum]
MNELNQLHHLSNIIETKLQRVANASTQTPPSPPSPSTTIIHPAINDQVTFHSGFCHCCMYTQTLFHKLRDDIHRLESLFTSPPTQVDDINIAESERYLPDEYLHPYKPLQRYQVDSNIVLYIEPYEKPEPIVTEDGASLDQNDQADQNDKIDLNDQNDPVQADEILTNDHLEHSNHNNENHIIDNLSNTEDV